MKKLVFIWFLIGLCTRVSAQSGTSDYEIISHEVKQGETIRMLSLKYFATPSDIYKLNKFAINGIEQGMVLMIPVKRKVKPAVAETVEEDIDAQHLSDADGETRVGNPQTHTVQSKETLTSIARKYSITIAELKAANVAVLRRGLQPGQLLNIPHAGHEYNAESPGLDNAPSESEKVIEHTVVGKETLYSIAKKYRITVDDIVKNNEQLLAHGLQAGQVIRIKPNK